MPRPSAKDASPTSPRCTCRSNSGSTATTHDSLEWTVPAELARSLRGRGKDLDGGLRSVVLTGWLVALWHAGGRPDGLAVTPMLTRRPFDEMISSIGQFEAPMPLLATVGAETTLTDLLHALDKDLTAHEQADERGMEPARQHARGVPGFRFSDVTNFTAQDGLAYSGLSVEPVVVGRKVTLLAQGVDDELRLTLRYQTGGMAEGGPQALLTCVQAVLSALGNDPTAAVASLAMLDEQAARDLVAATNPAQPPVQGQAHWHRQVEQTAQRVPDATAIEFGDRSWTYRELDTTANRLANELVERGVRAGDFVGLALDRSDVAIVSMLAIAKAGAGYVPLDPNLPPKRRTAIIASAGLTRAVATEDSATVLPSDMDTVLVDPEFTVCRERGDERPDVETTDDGPAYVLFTSGSTGTPKGVLVGHGQLASYLAGAVERLELTGEIDSVALGSLATDLGNTALFPPLFSGGRLVVVAPEVSADAQRLAELLVATDYDLLKMTPTHLDTVFGEVQDPLALIPRKALVVGGEPFGWGSFGLAHSFIGDCKLFNHYGPTETTVGVLCGHVNSKEMAALASTVPIGKPMAHARVYILDPQHRPVPVGLPGELWIGGSSVSQGYLAGTGDKDDRFLDDPFSPVSGARMYRSGDKARFLPDGTVEFLGRMDRQIKVRGFRVEMGEIESVMRQHPRVTNSLVVVKGENTAAQLVGYLIDAEGTRGAADWLREYLAERLPEFMVPAHYVALDAFPMTSTGKIDANLLPEPGFYGGDESTTYVEPKTPTEHKVADIMAQLLLLKRVSAEDDFFDIGGHSLLATQLISRLRDEFEVSIKLRNLFEAPVVSELAELIDELLERKEQDA